MEYPDNIAFVKLSENLEKLINGIDLKRDTLGKALVVK